MLVDISMDKDVLIVVLGGEIDHHYTEKIRNDIEMKFEENKAKNIVLSFKNVRFMDSSAIGMVIGRYKFVVARGGNLVACDLTLEAKRIFDMSGLGKIVDIYDTLEESLECFR